MWLGPYSLALDTTKADAPCRLFAAVVTNSSTLQNMVTMRASLMMAYNSHLSGWLYVVDGTGDLAH